MWTKGNFLVIYMKIKKIRIWIPITTHTARELLWQTLEIVELLNPVITNHIMKDYIKKGMVIMPELLKVLYVIGEYGSYDLVDIEVCDEKNNDIKISIKVW